MFGVDLRKAIHFAVGERAPQPMAKLVQIFHFFVAQRETFFFIIGSNIVDSFDGIRSAVDAEELLVELVVVRREHRVVGGGFGGSLHKNFHAPQALDAHVAGYLHRVGTPGSNHLFAWPDKATL